MKWWLIVIGVVICLPFYAYVLSKHITLGKLMAYRAILKMGKEEKEDENREV